MKNLITGEARFIDDIEAPSGLLHAALGFATITHGEILSLDFSDLTGVIAVYTARDLPHNDISPTHLHDEPILADKHILYHHQPIFMVVAETRDLARLAVKQAKITYKMQPAITTIDEALKDRRLVTKPLKLSRNTPLESRLKGLLTIGGQDHFYLEGHVALAVPQECGDMHVYSSTQHPSEVQHMVAAILQQPQNSVTVEVPRMGGGFGGKETQSNLFAVLASFAASRLQKPVKLRPDRDEDMAITGKRHDFKVDYALGFTDDGKITDVDATFAARCGFSADLSGPITDRALFHADNCYYYPNVTLQSLPLFTNTVSNTAFRGFGGPQGMVFAERLIEEIAFETGLDPLDVRYKNLYSPAQNTTPYHQIIDDFSFADILKKLEITSQYRARKAAIRNYNAGSKTLKKGIAITPVKFGISFTATWYNQAGALIHIYQDGSVLVNHGGTEMGQGLHQKIRQIVAETLEIPLSLVKISATRTDKVPNTSATAASSGTDLNGMAAMNAALILKARLDPFTGSFNSRVKQAYMARISLSTTGFYKTPDIHWDRETGRGHPFYYYASGAACSEVIIDTLTGENKVTRVDILHDCGTSINEALDRGQIEGGFVQGQGWLTTEELVYDKAGVLKTHAPSTYKIPVASDRPHIFNVDLWDKPHVKPTIKRSKAVGEPPLMLAISVLHALSDAVASTRNYELCPQLDPPATPEAILRTIENLR
jgi:xanthine dehydrogenase large subunit